MSKSTRRLGRAGIAAAATTALVASGLTAFAGAASASEPVDFERIAGSNRYATSVEATQAFGTSEEVILASGENGHYVDALSANFLAGVVEVPILLTKEDKLPGVVKQQLEDGDYSTVHIIGGDGAVSEAVEAEVRGTGADVNRLAGSNRYRTNVDVIQAGDEENSDTALIATGVNFPDALGAGPVAYAGKHPIGLTKTDDIPDFVVDALKSTGVDKAVIVGGEAAVGPEVAAELEAKGIDVVTRLSGGEGGNRETTSIAVREFALENLGFSESEVDFASGRAASEGVDALSGGPVSGKEDVAILITSSENRANRLVEYLEENCQSIDEGDIYGGDAAITVALEEALEEAAQCETNQSYAATPASNASVSSQEGADQQVTFSGIDAATVSIRLVSCDQLTVSDNGTVTFKDTAGDPNEADLAGAPNSSITGIDGVFSAYGDAQDDVVVGDDGSVTVTVDSTDAGCSRVVIFNDADNDNELDLAADDTPTEDFGVSGRLVVTNPDAVDASPENATNPYGESHTVTAQLIDQTAAADDDESSPEAGVNVRFSRYAGTCNPDNTTTSGTPVEVTNAVTDANGRATYTFNAQDPNPAATGNTTEFCVLAEADVNRDGDFGDTGEADLVKKVYNDQAPTATTVELTPATDTNPVGTQHTVTATVTDQFGSPVAGQEVDFNVNPSGLAADLDTTRTTDANGVATFTYAGPVDTATDNEREDAITATADDGNNTLGDTDPSDTATKSWVESGAINERTGTMYETVQAAIDAAQAGDTIRVFGGEETGPYDDLAGFNVTKPLTIVGTNSGTGGNATRIEGTIVVRNVDNVTIRGLDIVPGTFEAQLAGIYLDNAEGIVINQNEFLGADGTEADNGAGVINVTGGDAEIAQITSNNFRDLLQGVYANPSAQFTIQSNLFDGNAVGSANDAASTITGNTFRNSSIEGVGLNAAGSTVQGNSFADNVAHVADYTSGSVYDLQAMIGQNTFDEPVEVRPATDGPGVERIVDQDAP